jgi:two-component system chemotaxis response regulator CheB
MAENNVAKYKMVVIGGSAGSLEVVIRIVSQLPANGVTSFVIIVHRKNSADSILQNLLSTKTKLPVKEVEDKEKILPGTIYLAPPDYHLLFENESGFSLDTSEKIHHSRPSIDVTFESAAEIYGSSLIGVLLSGANADGSEGIKKISENKGLTIVQNPISAEVAFMPEQAINKMTPGAILHGHEIATYLQNILQ